MPQFDSRVDAGDQRLELRLAVQLQLGRIPVQDGAPHARQGLRNAPSPWNSTCSEFVPYRRFTSRTDTPSTTFPLLIRQSESLSFSA